jgi:hypothetical protein
MDKNVRYESAEVGGGRSVELGDPLGVGVGQVRKLSLDLPIS